MAAKRPTRQQGLTLIELVTFIVIVGIAVTGIVHLMAYTTSRSADPMRQKQALALAEGLMEEVRLARFTFCDPNDANAETATATGCATMTEGFGQEGAGPFQRPFDNVNDYVAAANTPAAPFTAGGVLTDVTGAPFPVGPGYTATVSISQVALPGIPSTETLEITVTVGYDNDSVVLQSYRTRYAPNLLP